MTGPDREVPDAWEQIREPTPDLEMNPVEVESRTPPLEPSRASLIGGTWGDLVAILAVCASTFLALTALGYDAGPAAFPWALALGLTWWTAAAMVLLVVRHGTPGMLLSGIVFENEVPRGRLVWVVLAALALCLTLGVTALLGARSSPLRLAAGVDIVSAASLGRATA